MSESYVLVLSGGGAKGVYHVGVWKALREMGVEVEAFVGSSVGAVTAAASTIVPGAAGSA